MNPFPAFAIPSLAIMSGCDRIPSGRRCAATPTISTWCLLTLLTKLLELAERWVGRIFCFRELLSHWGLQFKIYLSIKTREEVAKLATAVANVPVNPGALTFFLYTNCKCAIVSPGGEYYTQVCPSCLVSILKGWTWILLPLIQVEQKRFI